MWVWVGLVWRVCVGLGGVGLESLRGSVWVGLKSLCRFGWGWFGESVWVWVGLVWRVCVGLGGVLVGKGLSEM